VFQELRGNQGRSRRQKRVRGEEGRGGGEEGERRGRGGEGEGRGRGEERRGSEHTEIQRDPWPWVKEEKNLCPALLLSSPPFAFCVCEDWWIAQVHCACVCVRVCV